MQGSLQWLSLRRRMRDEEFKKIINTLHIEYFYNGNYPENYEDAFEKWHKEVEEFVRMLEKRERKE